MLPEVDAYIEQFDSHQSERLQTIRKLILDAHPGIQEKFIYKTPFYSLKKNLFYLTFHKKRKRFVIGFIEGYQMPDPCHLLISDDNQRYIRHLIIHMDTNIQYEIISTYLQLAITTHLH